MRNLRALPVLLIVALSACNLSDNVQEPDYRAQQGASCEVEGDTRDALVCRDGAWQHPAQTSADAPPDLNHDTPSDPTDAASDSDPDVTCTPETLSELCEANAWQCGAAETIDRCGRERLLDCGMCPGGARCEDNQCDSVCEPEADATLCEQQGAQCGPIEVTDRCGATRTVDCGGCEGGTCDVALNACLLCRPQSDESLCLGVGASCGEITAIDSCGAERTIDCSVAIGPCDTDERCNNNQCVCPAPRCLLDSCGPITNACGATTFCPCMPIEPCRPGEICLEPL